MKPSRRLRAVEPKASNPLPWIVVLGVALAGAVLFVALRHEEPTGSGAPSAPGAPAPASRERSVESVDGGGSWSDRLVENEAQATLEEHAAAVATIGLSADERSEFLEIARGITKGEVKQALAFSKPIADDDRERQLGLASYLSGVRAKRVANVREVLYIKRHQKK